MVLYNLSNIMSYIIIGTIRITDTVAAAGDSLCNSVGMYPDQKDLHGG